MFTGREHFPPGFGNINQTQPQGGYRFPCLEHQQQAMRGNWSSSGATEHSKVCHGQFNWLSAATLCIESDFYTRKVRESLEIQCMKVGPLDADGVNRDAGNFVKSNSWRSFFYDWRRKEPKNNRWNNFWNCQSNSIEGRYDEYDEREASIELLTNEENRILHSDDAPR